MTLPEQFLQAAINNEVTGEGSEAMFARRLERNFDALDERLTTTESRLTNWQSWTPTWANLTVGNGTLDQAVYSRAGNMVAFTLKFTLGSTSAVGTAPTFTLPIEASQSFLTSARYYDDSAAINYEGRCDRDSATTANLVVHITSGSYATRGSLAAIVPFTWATNDQIIVSGFYHAA